MKCPECGRTMTIARTLTLDLWTHKKYHCYCNVIVDVSIPVTEKYLDELGQDILNRLFEKEKEE